MEPLDITFTPLDEPPEVEPQQQTDLDKTEPVKLSEEAIQTRAMKYDVALSDQSPGRQWLESTLRSGQDSELRRTTAIQEDLKTLNTKMGLIQEISTANNGQLTPDELALVENMKTVTPADQATIMEKLYANKVMSSASQLDMMKNVVDVWAKYKPDAILDAMGWGSEALATSELMKTVRDEIQAKVDKLGFGSKVWYGAQSLLEPTGVLSSYRVKAAGQEAGIVQHGDYTPGSIVWNIIRQIEGLPPKQAHALAKGVLDNLWERNPNDALYVANALVSYSSSHIFADNAWFVANLATFGASSIGKGPIQAVPRYMTQAEKNNAILASVKMMNETWKKGVYDASQVPVLPWSESSLRLAARFGNDAYTEGRFKINDLPSGKTSIELTPHYYRTIDPLDDRELNELLSRMQPSGLTGGAKPVVRERSGLGPPETGDKVMVQKQEVTIIDQKDGRYQVINKDGDKGWFKPSELSPIEKKVIDQKNPERGLYRRAPEEENRTPKPPIGALGVKQIEDDIAAGVSPEEAVRRYMRFPGSKPAEAAVERQGVWKNADHDIPVTVLSEPPQKAPDGRMYQKVRYDNQESYVPHDELKIRGAGGSAFAGRLYLPGGEVRILQKFREVQNAISDIVEAAAHPKATVGNVLHAAGEVRKGAAIQVIDEMSKGFDQSLETFVDRAPGILKADTLGSNPGQMGAQFTKRMADEAQVSWSRLMSALAPEQGHARVARLPEQALAAALKQTADNMDKRYNHPGTSVIDVIYNRPENTDANIASVTKILGTPKATPFESRDQARFYGQVHYKLGTGNYDIVQQGAGYALKVTDHVDETLDIVRDWFTKTQATSTPVSIMNRFLGLIRTTPDIVSKLEMENRHIATHGTQLLNSAIKTEADKIGKLSREEWKNLRTFFERDNMEMRFSNTVGDFAAEYKNQFKVLPSERTVRAYFAYRQLNDFDYVIRNLGFQRDLTIQGVKEYRFIQRFPETESAPSSTAYSPYFMGKEVEKLPVGGKSYGVYHFDSDTGGFSYHRSNQLPREMMKLIDGSVQKDGYKILQIANPTERPIHEFVSGHGGDVINFVVVKDVSSRPLRPDMIPYKPGGHVEYSTQHFVKSPVISRAGGRHNYEGDVTVFGFHTEAEARKYSSVLNEAKRLMLTGDHVNLKSYLAKNLPEEFQMGRFQKYFDVNGGTWNSTQDFHYVPTGKTTLDVHPKMGQGLVGWSDEINSPHNLFVNVDKKFLGSRDEALQTIKELGSEQQPLFKLASADRIDPYTSLNRTVTNAAHARLVSDYKYFSVQNWAENFAHVIDADPEMLRRNPLYLLHNPQWRKGIDDAALATAQAQRLSILNFLGMDSPDVRMMKYVKDKMINSVYERMGQKASDWSSEHLLPAVKDPTSYARGIAFHSKLGLFNIPQFINQAQAALHAIALAGPVIGMKGLAGATLMQALRYTEKPEIIEHFAKIASKLGWADAEQFKEAYKQLRRSGWDLVQGETGWKDDVRDPTFLNRGISKGFGAVLDAGAWFFKEGERTSRLTAWNSAFLEWAGKNPGVKFDDRAMAQVLSRADLMNLNMTRSSLSVAQTGLGAIPLQFWTYQKHMVEQMLGGRLTWQEKARAIATYSAMYGLPVGVLGTTVGVWPMNDSIRQAALEQGISLDNPAMDLAMQGIPAWIGNTVFGRPYNIPQKGPQGIEALRDFWYGDKTLSELAVGVSGQTIKDIGRYAAPVARDIWDIAFSDGEGYKLLLQDTIAATRTISGMNNYAKAIYAVNYGKYYTRADSPVMDADAIDAVILATTGLTRQEAIDTFLKMDSTKHLEKTKDDARGAITIEIRKSLDWAEKGDHASAAAALKQAKALAVGAGFRNDELEDLHHQIMTSPRNVDMRQKVNFDFYVKKSPDPSRVNRYP